MRLTACHQADRSTAFPCSTPAIDEWPVLQVDDEQLDTYGTADIAGADAAAGGGVRDTRAAR
jgi:hypothetical protein